MILRRGRWLPEHGRSQRALSNLAQGGSANTEPGSTREGSRVRRDGLLNCGSEDAARLRIVAFVCGIGVRRALAKREKTMWSCLSTGAESPLLLVMPGRVISVVDRLFGVLFRDAGWRPLRG